MDQEPEPLAYGTTRRGRVVGDEDRATSGMFDGPITRNVGPGSHHNPCISEARGTYVALFADPVGLELVAGGNMVGLYLDWTGVGVEEKIGGERCLAIFPYAFVRYAEKLRASRELGS